MSPTQQAAQIISRYADELRECNTTADGDWGDDQELAAEHAAMVALAHRLQNLQLFLVRPEGDPRLYWTADIDAAMDYAAEHDASWISMWPLEKRA